MSMLSRELLSQLKCQPSIVLSHTEPSLLLEAGFVGLAILLVALFAWVLKSYKVLLAGGLWLFLAGAIAVAGVLSNFSATPPRIFFLLIPSFAATVAIGLSKAGKPFVQLPLAFLIGFQAFRIPVEILIHRAAVEGVAPPQMSWDGMNFDVASGVSALLLFGFANRVPKTVVLIWNTLALGLLAWVVGVAILSFPTPFQKLKPDNTWVTAFPFVWLPTVMVTAALLGHVAVYKKLLGRPATETHAGNEN